MILGQDVGFCDFKDSNGNIYPSKFTTDEKILSNGIKIIIDNVPYWAGVTALPKPL